MTDATEQAIPEAKNEDGFEWAIVEIFGHRSHRGRAREEERFGSKMLRIDEPTIQPDGSAIFATHYYGGSSIFSYTPTDEDTVMRFAKRHYATPAIPYRAPAEELDHDDAEQVGGEHD